MEDSLEALSNVLTKLSDNPYDLALHAEHLKLADASGMPDQALAARDMLTTFWAATDDVWLTVIEGNKKAEDAHTLQGVQAVLNAYERAEADYLSIDILNSHMQFLIDSHELFNPEEGTRPEDTGEFFTVTWTRDALELVAFKGQEHMFKSHVLWKRMFEWELEQLANLPAPARDEFVNHIQALFLTRLQQPHSNHDETFQEYSSFTTNYKPASEYESLLLSASKTKTQAVKAYGRREESEMYMSQNEDSLETYAYYISLERRARNPDLFVLRGLFERAIAAAAKRRFTQQADSEQYLRAFWIGYCDVLRLNDASRTERLNVYNRSLRSAPGSGELWSRYLRFLESNATEENADDGAMELETETVPDAHARALAIGLVAVDIEQIVPLTLARASYELRQGSNEDEVLASTAAALQGVEEGIALAQQASPQGDPRFRLEKYLADTCRRMGLTDNAKATWKSATDHHKTSYIAWTSYADLLTLLEEIDEARALYKKVCFKNLDWPEAVWEAWIDFEHRFGDITDIEECLDTVERARNQAEVRRAKEAAKVSYGTEQTAWTVAAPVAAIDVNANGSLMDVDTIAAPVHDSKKRKAEAGLAVQDAKRVKTETLPPAKRDRENCTVFVANLPKNIVEQDLVALFKDCGETREVKITDLENSLVATVEFVDRNSVSSALTKDKKRIHDAEVTVHLAWESTLYVTNFPEQTDDARIRDIFAEFGTIFDVRWPSKKFKDTRRFCYVQYTSPSAAQAALSLSGREIEPEQTLSVLISNPERKKERTDADASERELYVAGLSKFTTKIDLEKLFKTYGPLRDVRLASDDKGQCKGFAFVEFEAAVDTQRALAANNYELKKRRIAVTLADTRVTARHREETSNRKARRAGRALRIKNLPDGVQEGLLQQAVEKIAPVKRLEVFLDKNEAVVVFENAADVGSIMLKNEPFEFMGKFLLFSQDSAPGSSVIAATTTASGGMFIPRTATSRPRAGLGKARKPGIGATSVVDSGVGSSEKKQDDFRKMLGL